MTAILRLLISTGMALRTREQCKEIALLILRLLLLLLLLLLGQRLLLRRLLLLLLRVSATACYCS